MLSFMLKEISGALRNLLELGDYEQTVYCSVVCGEASYLNSSLKLKLYISRW
jgi:hypothetical protein